ncbi:MAG: 30S ribosomal protein S6 [Acidobacteria bacterium]|nr:30S ribosomal protein S6 [Acidobacteriota bacterium]
MRTYEVIFIIRPDMVEEDADKLVALMEAVVTNGGGKVRKTDRMGRRRLAYMVGRFREGIYVLLDIECDAATIMELERRLKVTEPVIKYQSVRTDEEMKRAAKLAAIRAKRPPSRRSRAAAPHAAPAAAAPSAPQAPPPPAAPPAPAAPVAGA